MNYGSWVISKLLIADKSQSWLARESGYVQGSISNWARGTSNPRPDAIIIIAECLAKVLSVNFIDMLLESLKCFEEYPMGLDD